MSPDSTVLEEELTETTGTEKVTAGHMEDGLLLKNRQILQHGEIPAEGIKQDLPDAKLGAF